MTLEEIKAQTIQALTALADVSPASPLKGRNHQREEVHESTIWEAVPANHREKVTEKTGHGYGPMRTMLVVSPEAYLLVEPWIAAELDEYIRSRGKSTVSLQNSPKHGGLALLRRLLPDGTWQTVTDDSEVHKSGSGARSYRVYCKIGDVIDVQGTAWVTDGNRSGPRGGRGLAVVTRTEGVICADGTAGALSMLRVQGWLPVSVLFCEIGTICATQEGVKLEETKDQPLLMKYPPGTEFLRDDHTLAEPGNERFSFQQNNGSGDGTFLVLENQHTKELGILDAGVFYKDDWQIREVCDITIDPEESRMVEVLTPETAVKLETENLTREKLAAQKQLQQAQEKEDNMILLPKAFVKKDTGKAFLVTDLKGGEDLWFPKSQSRWTGDEFFATKWILGQKGLLEEYI